MSHAPLVKSTSRERGPSSCCFASSPFGSSLLFRLPRPWFVFLFSPPPPPLPVPRSTALFSSLKGEFCDPPPTPVLPFPLTFFKSSPILGRSGPKAECLHPQENDSALPLPCYALVIFISPPCSLPLSLLRPPPLGRRMFKKLVENSFPPSDLPLLFSLWQYDCSLFPSSFWFHIDVLVAPTQIRRALSSLFLIRRREPLTTGLFHDRLT